MIAPVANTSRRRPFVAGVCALFCCLTASAQMTRLRQPPPQRPPDANPAMQPSVNPNVHPVPVPQVASNIPRALPPSVLDASPTPALIQFRPGYLAIAANNSSLDQILHDLSTQTGMKVDGPSGDERVFGSFGPGDPQTVISELLNGTPYNLLMVGDLENGAPRELILSHQNQTASQAHDYGSLSQGQPAPVQEEDSDNALPDNGPPPPGINPGAAPGQMGSPLPGVKTPQQMLQQLQRLQQQQQQQRQPQQQQPLQQNAPE